MTCSKAPAISSLFLALGAMAAPADDLTARVDLAVKNLADAQVRVMGKAASFCATSRLPEGRQLDSSLKSFVDAFSTGTKAGMIEIAQTDREFVNSTPPIGPRELEVMDQQAQQMLKRMQASPALECAGLSNFLDSGSSERFKEFTLQSHREFKSKRADYCARKPKPKSCE